MHRETKWSVSKTIEVRAKRYRDGGWVGCLVVPAARGETLACVRWDPRDTSKARDLARATADRTARIVRAYAPAFAQSDMVSGEYDFVGAMDGAVELVPPDIIGALADDARRYLAPIAREAHELAPHAGAGWVLGQADLVGLGEGLLASAGEKAAAFLGQVTQPIQRGFSQLGEVLSGERDPSTGRTATEDAAAQTWMQRVGNRAIATLRDPARSAAERAAALRVLLAGDEAGDVAFDRNSSQIRGWIAEGEGTAPSSAAPAPVSLSAKQRWFQSLGSASQSALAASSAAAARAAQAEATRAAQARALAAFQRQLPGGGSTAAQGGVTAGPILGAEELLAQARDQTIPAAADLTERALRAVDASAGAALGDPAAREVLRRAIASQSARVRAALQIANAVLSL